MINYNTSKLKIFASFYRPHVRLFVLDMVCALFIAVIDLCFPLATRFALNNLLPDNAYLNFFLLMSGLVAAYFLRAFLQYIVTFWGHTLGVRMEADMRQDLFAHIQTLPFSYFDSNRTGQIMSRLTTDLFEITELAHHGPEDLFISIVTIVGGFIALLRINATLAFVLLLLVPLTLIFTVSQRRRMSGASRKVKDKTAAINSAIESSISGVRVAKAFTNEDYEIERFSEGNEKFKQAKGGFYSSMAVFHSGMELIISLFSVVVIVLGGFLIMKNRLNIIDLLTFSLFVSIFTAPIKKLTMFVEQFVTGMAGFTRFVETMRVKPNITDSPNAEPLDNVTGNIAYDNVSFSYNDDKDILSNINLDIRAGKMVALVGPSGGGKTTLCHLLPRFYETTSGKITIDGKDIKEITLQSLRGNIGIVSQDVFLFAGTFRENIAYGRQGATEDEIIKAAKRAQIYDTIMQSENGLDTEVGERGVRLSGGQKQRISIARIFLKNPPILILDEATSALDTVTERLIQAAFDDLSKGRTSLVIAHRLSTIKNADEIIYIDENGIVERGAHDELLSRGGKYADLYNTQISEKENI